MLPPSRAGRNRDDRVDGGSWPARARAPLTGGVSGESPSRSLCQSTRANQRSRVDLSVGSAATSPRARLRRDSLTSASGMCSIGVWVLFVNAPIQPITEQIPDRVPLGKAQRLGRRAHESPALPLSYSAAVAKLIERDLQRHHSPQEGMTVAEHMTFGMPVEARIRPIRYASATQTST
jgi:hypothetical protein